MLTNSTEMLNKARNEHYAVPAFNVNNLEWAKSILQAAQIAKSPVILQVTKGAADYMGSFRLAYDLIVDLHDALNITVPIAIHLDHGAYFDVIKTLGISYTSVMFDGSSEPFKDNLKNTKILRKLTNDLNVSLEAEIGTIGGEEDGVIGDGELASISEAVLMAKSGIDMLAVGIGNIHGKYPKDWKGLNFAHLRNIDKAIYEEIGRKIPLVLHGGSGIPDNQIAEAIKMGIAKINVNTEGQLAFHNGIRNYVISNQDLNKKNYDPRIFLKVGSNELIKMCLNRIAVFGSGNKA